MDNWADAIDWILRITGAFSLIIMTINLFVKDFEWVDNITIISQPDANDLEKCQAIREYSLGEPNGERTLFLPTTGLIKSLKIYSVQLTDHGHIKKDEVIYKFERIMPFEGLLINVYRNCGAPSYMIEWTVDYGGKAAYYFTENGFNGNNNISIVKYNYGFLSRIRKKLQIK